LPEQHIEAEPEQKLELQRMEESLQKLWEKARLVSDSLIRLKSENKELRERIAGISSQEHQTTDELRKKLSELEQVRVQLGEAQSNGHNLLSKEETDALIIRLKELIVKINSRL
jgi:chromosome segregation ATPase